MKAVAGHSCIALTYSCLALTYGCLVLTCSCLVLTCTSLGCSLSCSRKALRVPQGRVPAWDKDKIQHSLVLTNTPARLARAYLAGK